MYSTSNCTFRFTSSRFVSYDWLTWAQPVMPGRARCRFWYSGISSPQLREDARALRTRAHEVHVAPQHVEQLGQFVQPELAQHLADAS